MKDFSRQARVVEFRIGENVFRGKPHLPAQTMIDFTVRMESVDDKTATPEQGFAAMMESLQMVLTPDSYKLFREHMQDPGEDAAGSYVPIELDQVPDILEYLMGEYGLRPTQLSEGSSDGSPDPAPGTNLTASTPVVESISAASPQISS